MVLSMECEHRVQGIKKYVRTLVEYNVTKLSNKFINMYVYNSIYKLKQICMFIIERYLSWQ